MDAAARKTGIDPRRAAPAQHDPARADAVHESDGQDLRQRPVRDGDGPGDRARRLERVRGARARSRKARGRLRGRGMATFLEWTGADVFEEQVTVTVSTATATSRSSRRRRRWGRGSRRRIAQLAVDVFGVPIEQDPHRAGRHRSRHRLRQRGLALAVRRRLGGARRAPSARSTRRRSSRRASSKRRPATSSTRDGAFRIAGTDRRIGLFELARKQPEQRIVLVSVSSVADATWPNGCHICEVEIDPDTGAVDDRRATGRSTTSAASSIR